MQDKCAEYGENSVTILYFYFYFYFLKKLGGEIAECMFVFEIPGLREQVKKKLGETKTWALNSLTEEVLSRLN
jgi:hypothetical protein